MDFARNSMHNDAGLAKSQFKEESFEVRVKDQVGSVKITLESHQQAQHLGENLQLLAAPLTGPSGHGNVPLNQEA